MIEISKKIKVRITKKVAIFYFPNAQGTNVKYLPGDIVEIPEKIFRPDFMEKVVVPPPKPEPETPKEEETVEVTETTEEPEITKEMQEKMSEFPAATKEFPGDVVIDDELVPAEDTLDTMATPEEPKKERKPDKKKGKRKN